MYRRNSIEESLFSMRLNFDYLKIDYLLCLVLGHANLFSDCCAENFSRVKMKLWEKTESNFLYRFHPLNDFTSFFYKDIEETFSNICQRSNSFQIKCRFSYLYYPQHGDVNSCTNIFIGIYIVLSNKYIVSLMQRRFTKHNASSELFVIDDCTLLAAQWLLLLMKVSALYWTD